MIIKKQLVTKLTQTWRLLATPIRDAIYRAMPLRVIGRFLANRFVPEEITEIEISEGPLKGYRLLVDLKSEKRFWLGMYEDDLQEAFRNYVHEGMVAYDVGANIGFTTLLLTQAVGPMGQVIAFEPLPINARRLRENITLNQLEKKVHVVEKAISDTDAIVSFLAYQWSGMGHLQGVRDTNSHPLEIVDVVATTLDDFVYSKGNPQPDFIKIDVEGAEANVLRGAQRLIAEVKPLMILELHSSQAAEEVREILSGMGYRMYDLKGSFVDLRSISISNEPIRVLTRYAA
jgi:FkbM family methyltransferase